MNTKSVIVLMLFIGGFCLEMSAQQNILAVVKKCETSESVEMSVIRKRNEDTKQLERSITSITIKSNPALVDEFIAAFKQDEPNATQVIDTYVKGKLVPQLYRFSNVSVSFSLQGSGGNASVTVIEKSKSKPAAVIKK